nr:immunoglobulin light chain junction region [Macaca mulatta]MPN89586.1 immunoglobulin light chain junction region [Macaca mulatta]
CMQDLQTPYSF